MNINIDMYVYIDALVRFDPLAQVPRRPQEVEESSGPRPLQRPRAGAQAARAHLERPNPLSSYGMV